MKRDADKPLGLVCKTCGCGHFWVIYVRPKANGRIQRRKECRHCGRRITTNEIGP